MGGFRIWWRCYFWWSFSRNVGFPGSLPLWRSSNTLQGSKWLNIKICVVSWSVWSNVAVCQVSDGFVHCFMWSVAGKFSTRMPSFGRKVEEILIRTLYIPLWRWKFPQQQSQILTNHMLLLERFGVPKSLSSAVSFLHLAQGVWPSNMPEIGQDGTPPGSVGCKNKAGDAKR